MRQYFDDNVEFWNTAIAAIKNVDSVLDIGCGIRPQPFINPITHICCEPFEEYIDVLQKKDTKKLILKSDWQNVVEILPRKSVDTIFLLDVIEHLDKNEGKKLLEKTVEIARCQVVIFTPLGFLAQHHEDGIDAWGYHGGAWQEHRSGWMPEDFSGQWDFFICESFHKENAMGEKLAKPFGAFWAIWNGNDSEKFYSSSGHYIDVLNQFDRNVSNQLIRVIDNCSTTKLNKLTDFLNDNFIDEKWNLVLKVDCFIKNLVNKGLDICEIEEYFKKSIDLIHDKKKYTQMLNLFNGIKEIINEEEALSNLKKYTSLLSEQEYDSYEMNKLFDYIYSNEKFEPQRWNEIVQYVETLNKLQTTEEITEFINFISNKERFEPQRWKEITQYIELLDTSKKAEHEVTEFINFISKKEEFEPQRWKEITQYIELLNTSKKAEHEITEFINFISKKEEFEPQRWKEIIQYIELLDTSKKAEHEITEFINFISKKEEFEPKRWRDLSEYILLLEKNNEVNVQFTNFLKDIGAEQKEILQFIMNFYKSKRWKFFKYLNTCINNVKSIKNKIAKRKHD